MVLVYRFFEITLKVALLLGLLTFERVVGVPILFFTAVLSLMILARPISKYLVYVIAAILLAVVYEMSLGISLFLLATAYCSFIFGSRLIESNLQRFLGIVLVLITVVVLTTSVSLGFWQLLQILVGSIVSVGILLKYVLVRYGFFGVRTTAKVL